MSTTTTRRRRAATVGALLATVTLASPGVAAAAPAFPPPSNPPVTRFYLTEAACEIDRAAAEAARLKVDPACWRVDFRPLERPRGWAFRIY
jgi:hypothetical protein